MRFWKAGLAAAALFSAGAIGLAAGTPKDPAPEDTQSVYSTHEESPIAHAFEALSPGSSRIGASIRDVTAGDVTERKLASESGALVTDVEDDTPADEAGLLDGDVILEFDGERVRSARHLTRLVQETPTGRDVAAVIWRNGNRMTLTLTPESSSRGVFTWRGFDAPLPPSPPYPPDTPRPPMPPRAPRPPSAPHLEWFGDRDFTFSVGYGRLGIGIEPLSEQLAAYFGVEEGVLITSVEEDSAAAKAGLRAGDVITKINGDAIDDGSDVFRELQRADGKAELEIVRDKKTQTVTATIEESSRRRSVRRVI